jgi:membrane protease YdiL (CAAX protease family)
MTFKTSNSRVIEWVREMLFFLLFCIVFSLVGIVIIKIFSGFVGIEAISNLGNSLNEESTFSDRNNIRIILFINQLFLFVLPCIAYGIWKFKSKLFSSFKLNHFPKGFNVLLVILIILTAYPFILLMMWLNELIPISEAMLAMEEQAAETTKYLLTMDSIGEFIFTLFIVAVTPAVGEEFVFRGVLQPIFERLFKNGHAAVWVSAILFSAIHLQMQGFLPRMLLGAFLGYFFLYTRNLWLPMIAHFIFNGSQVVAQFSGRIETENPEIIFSEIIIPASVSLVIVIILSHQFLNRNQLKSAE